MFSDTNEKKSGGERDRPGSFSRTRSFSIRFVCQQGSLEIQSLLLAISLKKHLKVPHELIACVPFPESVWGAPSQTTLELFDTLGVRVEKVENPLGKEQVHANKMPCLSLPTTMDKIVFFDSDILCLRDFHDGEQFSSQAALKPADVVRVVFSDDEWREIYSAAGLAMPAERVQTTVSLQDSPPWYNGGFLAFDSDLALGKVWLEIAQQFGEHQLELSKKNAELPQERFWSDQVSLSVALERLKVKVASLDENYNYPAHFRRVRSDDKPIFCHYHWPSVIRREPVLTEFVKGMLKEYPELQALVEADSSWKVILPPHKVQPRTYWFSSKVSSDGPNIIITGIPRSGTSYLCKRLHQFDNCVALNEPNEVVNRLVLYPWALETFLFETRLSILDGEVISNKMKDGEVVEDTAIDIEDVPYLPSVRSANFVLAVKNNRPILNRLDLLMNFVSPETRFVACIRNPIDAIASWIKSFDQLKEVDFSQVRVGAPSDRFLSPEDKLEIEAIDALSNVAERRARLWNYLAAKILKYQDRMLIVRYDKLVTEPVATLNSILAGADAGYPREDIAGSAPRSRRDTLSEEDWEVIFDLCAPNARALNVPIDHLYEQRSSKKTVVPALK